MVDQRDNRVRGGSLTIAVLATLLSNAATVSLAEESLPEVTVIEQARRAGIFVADGPDNVMPAPDTASLLLRAPGADLNDNGPLSGQTQYRGLFGPRMNVRLDGMKMEPGGPNWMDPPLHYVPQPLLGSLELVRGIAPVSSGSGIGGVVRAEMLTSEFGTDTSLRGGGRLVAGGRSVDDGSTLAAMVGYGNDNHRFHVLGASERGQDIEFGSGTMGASSHERDTVGLGYGHRRDSPEHRTELSVDYLHTDTGDSGNPVLPLDIHFLDAERLNLGLIETRGDLELKGRIHVSNIDHEMSNYRLRTPPDFSALPLPPFEGEDRRFVTAEADSVGWAFSAAWEAGDGEVAIGMAGQSASHDAVVKDPDVPPFFVTNFNDATSRHVSLFAEWYSVLPRSATLELGARYTRVDMDAGPVDAQPAQLVDDGMFGPGSPPYAVWSLRERFNSADRDVSDGNLDLVARAGLPLTDTLNAGIGFARKTRSPTYIERYLWIPLEVNAGLGDGNNYVGDIELDPEVAYQIEMSLTWEAESAYVTPRLFYNRVDDYIQGVASIDEMVVAVSGNANGDTTPLQFANVDAELYGLDATWGVRITAALRVDGVLSYVRGKRRDIDDDLYRIAPLNARAAFTYETANWSATLEGVGYDAQNNVSRTIVLDEMRTSNRPTPGYGLLNLFGRWDAGSGLALDVGIENLFDRAYTNHVAGFNRVPDGDVAPGVRLPGRGRNVFATISYSW